jgi:hypothetical protein
MVDMKVRGPKKKEKTELVYIFDYLLELIIKYLVIWNFFSFTIWGIWVIFFMENPLYRLKFDEISPPPPKRKTTSPTP